MHKLKKILLKNKIIISFYNIFQLRFKNKGKNNIIKNNNSIFKKTKIIVHGNNNRIIIDKNCRFNNSIIEIYGNNNTVILNKNILFREVDVFIEDSNNFLQIGDNTKFCGRIQIALIEGTKIEIGKECLFSSGIQIKTGDSHTIIDNQSKKRINKSQNIKICNHVWVTANSTILKGVTISNDTIIGCNSVITKKIVETNCIVAGIPGKIVKRDVNWNIERI